VDQPNLYIKTAFGLFEREVRTPLREYLDC
jgi:hypothetical protein